MLVAGSMGPVGGLIKPYGPLEAEDVKATFAEQAKALAEGGVDLLVIETMFAFEETTAAFEGAKSVTDLPIVVSFSYDRGTRSMMGVKPKDVMKRYTEMGANVIGANCGTTLENMEADCQGICERPCQISRCGPNPMRASRTWILKPSKPSTIWVPKIWRTYAKKYVELGAKIVGGCCGNTPEHIAAIAKAVK